MPSFSEHVRYLPFSCSSFCTTRIKVMYNTLHNRMLQSIVVVVVVVLVVVVVVVMMMMMMMMMTTTTDTEFLISAKNVK